ncbi:MAG: tyrosine-type recombinase/integrase [Methyloceanibacter sp.]
MSVRKRRWVTRSGVPREAWIVDYTDQSGERHIETFKRKKDADARADKVGVDVRDGVHISPGKSITAKEAAANWIKAAEATGLERTTVDQYRQHKDLHIVPFIGALKLSEISAATVRNFEDRLREAGRSPAMVRKVRASLGSLLADAQEQGLAARNAVRDLRRNRRRGKEHQAEKRLKSKLKIGVDIPMPGEIKVIVDGAKGRWRPLFITAIFTGLRASELRGLRWKDVDLKKGELYVRQRADRFNEIGKPKSEAGERLVPFGKLVANTLREWKVACPKSDGDLVFPNGEGNVESLGNIINRGLIPAQIAASLTVPVLDDKGSPKRDDKGTPMVRAKYTGMHALRHFYASWLINRVEEGGLGLPPKIVQERLGHSSITLTYDRYGHLFPRGDDSKEIDAAERALLA